MTKDMLYKYFTLGLSVLPPTAIAQPVKFAWSEVPEADYYQGTVTLDQGSATFRTRSRWILLPEGSSLDVKPYGNEGQVLTGVIVTPTREADFKEKSAPPSEHDVPPPPPPPVPKKTKVVKKVSRKPNPAQSPGNTNLSSHVVLRLGLGRDRLTSSGGLYGYSGQSNIAPVTLGGLWVMSAGSDWGIRADLSYHSFEATTVVEPIDGGDSSQNKDRFSRVHGWIGATLRAMGSIGAGWLQTLDLNIGLSHVQLPNLKVSDPSTGQASLVAARSNRLGLQGTYEWAAKSGLKFGLELRYAPFSLEAHALSDGYGAHIYSGYKIFGRQTLDFGVHMSADKISSKSSCEGAIDCPSQTTSTSRLTDLRVGYRRSF